MTTDNQAVKKIGRPKGSLNRKSQLARDIIERLKCDPLEYLISIVKNRRLPIELRLDAAKSAAPYVHARLSTTAVTAHVSHDVSLITRIQEIAAHNPDIRAAMEKVALAAALPPENQKLLESGEIHEGELID